MVVDVREKIMSNEFNLIAEDGIIILEESKDVEIDRSKFTILADKEWGGTRVLFLRHY